MASFDNPIHKQKALECAQHFGTQNCILNQD
jgi:hypothetical protein